MNKKYITSKIQNSLNNSVPNMLDEILLKCQKKKGTIIMNKKEEIKNKKNYFIPKLSLALTSLILVFGLTYVGYKQNYKIDSIIELDVNPSIEIKVNEKNRVIDVLAKNDDAKKVLNGMDLKKTDIDVALNAIIGAMITNGYIDDLSNSILLTVENKDEVKSEELRKELSNKVNNIMNNDKIKGSVLSQNLIEPTKEVKELTQKYDMSLGKASLIVELLNNNKLLKEKDLVTLSINELNVLSTAKTNKLETVKKEGTASTKSYITKEKAKQIALNHAKVTNPKYFEIEFDADDGLIVYEIEFETTNNEYDYEINAKTGKIIKAEKEHEYTENKETSNNKVNSNTNTSESNKVNSATNYITKEKAKQIALNHAKVTNPRKLEIELDREENEYEIEFESNKMEYSYEINAKTGKIKKVEKEPVDD